MDHGSKQFQTQKFRWIKPESIETWPIYTDLPRLKNIGSARKLLDLHPIQQDHAVQPAAAEVQQTHLSPISILSHLWSRKNLEKHLGADETAVRSYTSPTQCYLVSVMAQPQYVVVDAAYEMTQIIPKSSKKIWRDPKSSHNHSKGWCSFFFNLFHLHQQLGRVTGSQQVLWQFWAQQW